MEAGDYAWQIALAAQEKLDQLLRADQRADALQRALAQCHEVIGLLSSMVSCGEQHSTRSREMTEEALKAGKLWIRLPDEPARRDGA